MKEYSLYADVGISDLRITIKAKSLERIDKRSILVNDEIEIEVGTDIIKIEEVDSKSNKDKSSLSEEPVPF